MTEYTAEDFAYARFAVGPDTSRHNAIWDDEVKTWRYGSGVVTDAKRLARGGWRPIVEADHPARPLAGYRAQVMELREKVRGLREAPLTLDTLREAWENAEVPTEEAPVREGDTLIEFFAHGAYHVYSAAADYSSLPMAVRILRRAPQPEPWEGLAKVLGDVLIGTPEDIARALYGKGVRVTGGDDDE